ncbi:MAG: 50S ribosomal protein L4 [Planctomycetota bacterium]
MKNILVKNSNGTEVDRLELDESVFGQEVSPKLIHQVILMYHANERVGTACTKRRGDVAGSGKKPYAQKHTGRARAGSIRSPLWRKGGVIFGPKPRNFSFPVPKKMVRAALAGALRSKFADNEVVVVDQLSLSEPKTKEMAKILHNLGVSNSCLVVITDSSQNIYKSGRNIPRIKVTKVQDLNALEVLKYRNLLLTKEAADYIKSRFGNVKEEINK